MLTKPAFFQTKPNSFWTELEFSFQKPNWNRREIKKKFIPTKFVRFLYRWVVSCADLCSVSMQTCSMNLQAKARRSAWKCQLCVSVVVNDSAFVSVSDFTGILCSLLTFILVIELTFTFVSLILRNVLNCLWGNVRQWQISIMQLGVPLFHMQWAIVLCECANCSLIMCLLIYSSYGLWSVSARRRSCPSFFCFWAQ